MKSAVSGTRNAARTFRAQDLHFRAGAGEDSQHRTSRVAAHLDQGRLNEVVFRPAGRVGQHGDQRLDAGDSRAPEPGDCLGASLGRRVVQLLDQLGQPLGALNRLRVGRQDRAGQLTRRRTQFRDRREIEKRLQAELSGKVGQFSVARIGVEGLLQEFLGQVGPLEVEEDFRAADEFGGSAGLALQDRQYGWVLRRGRLGGQRRLGRRLGGSRLARRGLAPLLLAQARRRRGQHRRIGKRQRIATRLGSGGASC